MTHYLDIILKNTGELPPVLIINKLFPVLHLALVREHEQVGLSFPKYTERFLGNILRLHGKEEQLQAVINNMQLPKILAQYVSFSPVQKVDASRVCGHVVFSRLHVKNNSAQRLRRYARRHPGEPLPDYKNEQCTLPYILINSLSTGQTFRLYIKRGPVSDTPVPGEFSAYGLSDTATVPLF